MDAMEIQSQGDLNRRTHRATRRRHNLLVLQLGVLVSLLFLTCALPATARAVEVPNVVGSSQATAEEAITKANLRVGNITSAESVTVLPGTIISQDPAAGINVVRGTRVDLVVSGVAVPDVVGRKQADAQKDLTKAGLTVGRVTTANSATVAAGRVISQNPTAGTSVALGVWWTWWCH